MGVYNGEPKGSVCKAHTDRTHFHRTDFIVLVKRNNKLNGNIMMKYFKPGE